MGTTADTGPEPDPTPARPSFWPLGLALLGVVAIVVGVLTASDDAEEKAAPERPAPTAKPLQLTKLSTLPVGARGVPQLLDGVVLYTDVAERWVLADARTGAPRWTLGEDLPGGGRKWDPLAEPLLVAHPTGPAVLVEYCELVCVGNPGGDGVALLSGRDGSMLWRTQTVDGDPRSPDNHVATVIQTADERTAMVTMQPAPGMAPPEPGELRVLALDVSTGAVRWETRDIWPLRVSGDVVLGTVGARPTRYRDFSAPAQNRTWPSVVTALDVGTGQKLWDFTGQARDSILVTVAGHAALVFGGGGVRQVVDVRTGRELADFRDVWYVDGCAGSVDSTLIACAMRDGAAIRTFDGADDSTEVTVGELRGGVTADVVWRNRIIDASTGKTPRTFDPTGNRIDAKLPGLIIDSSGDLVLVAMAGREKPGGTRTTSDVAVYEDSRS